jgi:beta-glucosidase
MRRLTHLAKPRRRRPEAKLPAGRPWHMPADFLFGAASASHQVEGLDVASDWWRFEREPGRVRNFENYPRFAQEKKSDHWARFDEDVRRMRDELGLSTYRFSIDWSRVAPRPGHFDEAVIDRYAQWCATLRDAGIRPCVTLFHWSSPDWIWDHDREEETGWYDPAVVEHFTAFCERIVPALAPHVDLFCTFNEPNIWLYGSYSEGILCPGHRRRDGALIPVLRNLLRAHVRAWRIIKEARADAEVGIAHHFYVFEPSGRLRPLESVAAALVEQGFTWSIPDALMTGRMIFAARSGKIHRETLDGLKGTADFFGVNYYERVPVRLPGGFDFRRLEVRHDHHDDKSIWPKEIYTAGFLEVLKTAWKRYGLPLYITENGRAHLDDDARKAFLVAHLQTLAHAVCDLRIDVRAYYWWSLLDNQEWANGFLPRLGLYEIDYETGARRLRGTARAYAEIVRSGIVPAV